MAKRNVQMHFRVSQEEEKLIREKMKQTGIRSIGVYLRKMSLEGYCIQLDLSDVKEVVRLLRICSNNLNQYAKKANDSANHFHELSEKIKEAEKKLSEIAVLKTHIYNYAKTREVYVAYRRAGYSKKFLEEHREEITLHKAAKEAFGNLQTDKLPKIKELNEAYADILKQKKELYAEYRQVKKEMQDYVTAKHNIDFFFKTYENEKAVQDKRQQKEKKKGR